MSISAAMAASSGGKISRKNTYMAMGFAAVAGGGCTLIGSTTQLGINAILPDLGVEQLSMFCFMGPGLGVVALLVVYYATFGYKRQLKYFDFQETEAEPAPEAEKRAAAASSRPGCPSSCSSSALCSQRSRRSTPLL